MRIAVAVACCLGVLFVIMDVFNTIVLARRTRNSFRITRAWYRLSWTPYAWAARRIGSGRAREAFLGAYGPASLIALFAVWAVILIVAFGGLQWATGMRPSGMKGAAGTDFYLSATTFFTLDSGGPQNPSSRLITIVEAALGFSLLGLVVGYLPVFYEAFARRELQISLLDARAGSPPSARELLAIPVSRAERAERYLEQWEEWAAEILENQLSFPMMVWFRSHHANQSWLTALTAMIDCAAVISLCSEGDLKTQAGYTFATARHALVDLGSILHLEPGAADEGRLNDEGFAAICETVRQSSLPLKANALSREELNTLRRLYEPWAHSLSRYLLMGLPDWNPGGKATGNWRKAPSMADHTAVSDPFSTGSDL